LTSLLAAALAPALSAGARTNPGMLEPAATDPAVPGAEPASTPFRLTFSPYIWLTSFSGTTGAAGLKFDIDETFIDIVDNSDSILGIMGAMDINYKKFVFQLNGTYSQAEFSGQHGRAPGGAGLDIAVDGDVDVTAGWYEAFGGYRFIDKPLRDPATSKARFVLDGLIGGRFTDMTIDQTVTAQAMLTLPDGRVLEAGRSHTIDQDKGWFEPYVGARAGFQLSEHWGVIFRGDVGGFDLDGSQFAWQAIGMVGYQWLKKDFSVGIYAGYRALGQDYTDEGFTWDVITHGPVIGAEFSFFF
jgi:hypothetical protein